MQDPQSTSFLELGAGKAYLACMLAEAFPVRSLVLVDSHSFKLQGDRCSSVACLLNAPESEHPVLCLNIWRALKTGPPDAFIPCSALPPGAPRLTVSTDFASRAWCCDPPMEVLGAAGMKLNAVSDVLRY